MAENLTIPAYFIAVMLFLARLRAGKSKPWKNLLPPNLLTLDLAKRLQSDPASIKLAASDYGNIVHEPPAAVFHPSTVQDIVNLIKFAYNSSVPFGISVRGHGHSVHGQAMAHKGVVIDMGSLRTHRKKSGVKVVMAAAAAAKCPSNASGYYADVGGEQLWADVLREALEYGLAPASWTDYLYLSVGGTLSNAGISGQSFRYGPQISNVYEMDVVTGKGELVTCSANNNSELFYAVLGGLGQFGIITRARIALDTAPKRVKWVRMLYKDFSEFTEDQEHLISKNGRKERKGIDYLEGSLLVDQGPLNNWRSSFFPPSDVQRIRSLVTQHAIIYCLEIAKYYDDASQFTVHQELGELLEGLRYVEGFRYEKDVTYVEFLDRVRSGEKKLESQGLWDVPHPWLNMFIPKSRISDFNSGVFRDIVLRRNITKGPVLFYPMNRHKWDERMSAVIPDEEVFYTVGFLHSSGFNEWKVYDDQNKDILKYCEEAGIEVKQYLPHFTTQDGWIHHFGSKWNIFSERKSQFDPKMLLSPGQRIFNHI